MEMRCSYHSLKLPEMVMEKVGNFAASAGPAIEYLCDNCGRMAADQWPPLSKATFVAEPLERAFGLTLGPSISLGTAAPLDFARDCCCPAFREPRSPRSRSRTCCTRSS